MHVIEIVFNVHNGYMYTMGTCTQWVHVRMYKLLLNRIEQLNIF